jgi:hypothetical protein
MNRINEANIGRSRLDGAPKGKRSKLTFDEFSILQHIAASVYDAMEADEVTGTFTDGGRITIGLTGEQMFDLFEAKRKLHAQMISQKTI